MNDDAQIPTFDELPPAAEGDHPLPTEDPFAMRVDLAPVEEPPSSRLPPPIVIDQPPWQHPATGMPEQLAGVFPPAPIVDDDDGDDDVLDLVDPIEIGRPPFPEESEEPLALDQGLEPLDSEEGPEPLDLDEGRDPLLALDEEAQAAAPEPSPEPVHDVQRLFGLAAEFHRQGRLAEAIKGYGRVLAYDPRHGDAHNNLGVALRAQGKARAALACYRRALALGVSNSGIYSNMGNALRELGRMKEAVAAHEKAVGMAPGEAEPIYNLGLALKDLGMIPTALACFDKTLELKPEHVDCHWDRSLTNLVAGDLEEGFEEYEWRWRRPDTPLRKFKQPMWDGSELEGRTILIHHEQGFGDMIQFARYVPMVKARGGVVVVEVQPELARLFSSLKGVDKVLPRGGVAPHFDVHVPMMSLPRVFGTTMDDIPFSFPYLSAPDQPDVVPPRRPGEGLRVGISWAGKPNHRNDRNRSCGLEDFLPLMDSPETSFYSLQKGPRAREIALLACDGLVTDLGGGLQDFGDTAAALEGVDLVITVDTALAHLAGAMMKPVWVVIPHVPDWRWLLDREDTIWYPTMRLFRQESHGDWDGVFERVRETLAAFKP